MPPDQLFGSTVSLLANVLDLRTQRQSLIASNISNVDTPEYKAVRLDFEKELQSAVGSPHQTKLTRTNERHLPSADFNNIHARVVTDPIQKSSPDGNTVDIDRELTKMSKNHLMYNVTAQILAQRFTSLKSVIREGK